MATSVHKPGSTQATQLTFTLCSGSAHPQKFRRVLAGLEREENEKKPGFCCPVHREMFEDEFDSEEEVSVVRPVKEGGKVAFIEEVPFEAKHHLIVTHGKRETGSQCALDETQANLMAELANRPVNPVDASTVTIRQTQKYSLTLHLPEYSQPKVSQKAIRNQFPDAPLTDIRTVECSICNARFTSGQALGGHTSRKHSKFNRVKRPRSEEQA